MSQAKSLGELAKEIREKSGNGVKVTQRQLGDRFSAGASTIQNYELGGVIPAPALAKYAVLAFDLGMTEAGQLFMQAMLSAIPNEMMVLINADIQAAGDTAKAINYVKKMSQGLGTKNKRGGGA